MTRIILLAGALATAGFTQQWEFGGVAGGGFLNHVSVTSPAGGAATAGFQNGVAFGGYLGYNSYKHIGGELHYTYLQSNLRLASNGADATFAGASHAFHYDVTFHTAKSESKTEFFAAVGGGAKVFRATGKEAAYQPLSNFGYFTKAQSVKPMATVAVGAKLRLTGRVFLRAEVRDYLTMFPKEVLTPPAGVKYGFLLHDIVPVVGIGMNM
jgi:hypothetical protein